MKSQVSDSIPCGILLALSGGCMDAYSYLYRGRVFANAQTGNMLLFGVNLVSGSFANALKYLFPILAFTAGIILSDIINNKQNYIKLHWRQISVFIEVVILTGVAFIPESANALANALTSFACGIQVESFQKIHGNNIATTMCIGNLRSGTHNLVNYFFNNNKKDLSKALLYYGIILSFIIGAVIESKIIPVSNNYAILLSSVLLVIVLLIMFKSNSEEEVSNN